MWYKNKSFSEFAKVLLHGDALPEAAESLIASSKKGHTITCSICSQCCRFFAIVSAVLRLFFALLCNVAVYTMNKTPGSTRHNQHICHFAVRELILFEDADK